MNHPIERVTRARLSNGASLTIPSPNAKNHNRIELCAKIGSFDSDSRVVISHGKTGPWCSAYVVIDAEAVSVYEYPGKERLLERTPHGLSISGSIAVSISVKAGFLAELVIAVASGSFSKEIYWNGSSGDILAEVLGATLLDCTLTYCLDGVNRDLWFFGDSYLDFWCQWVIGRGLDNFYLDGHSGRTSARALASLKTDLSYAKPQRIVWLMGMNDPDGEEVNSSWITSYHTLRDICLEKSIELILATVPNTPIRNHRCKNEIVRSSGYRYLDISTAVGAETDIGWRDGLLSADRVHPSAEGAEAIARYILSALPEIGSD